MAYVDHMKNAEDARKRSEYAKYVSMKTTVQRSKVQSLFRKMNVKWRAIDKLNIASEDHPLFREYQTSVARWEEAEEEAMCMEKEQEQRIGEQWIEEALSELPGIEAVPCVVLASGTLATNSTQNSGDESSISLN